MLFVVNELKLRVGKKGLKSVEFIEHCENVYEHMDFSGYAFRVYDMSSLKYFLSLWLENLGVSESEYANVTVGELVKRYNECIEINGAFSFDEASIEHGKVYRVL
jgi:hypothetical protein